MKTNALNSILHEFSVVNKRLYRIENSMATKADVIEIKKDLTHTKDDVATIKEDLANTQADVAIMKEDLANTQADVATMKEDLANTQADVATMKEDLAHTQTEVVEIKEDLENVKSMTHTIFELVAINAENITEIKNEQKKISQIVTKMADIQQKQESTINLLARRSIDQEDEIRNIK